MLPEPGVGVKALRRVGPWPGWAEAQSSLAVSGAPFSVLVRAPVGYNSLLSRNDGFIEPLYRAHERIPRQRYAREARP